MKIKPYPISPSKEQDFFFFSKWLSEIFLQNISGSGRVSCILRITELIEKPLSCNDPNQCHFGMFMAITELTGSKRQETEDTFSSILEDVFES